MLECGVDCSVAVSEDGADSSAQSFLCEKESHQQKSFELARAPGMAFHRL